MRPFQAALVLLLQVAVACRPSAPPEPAPVTAILLEVPAGTDSTVRLAQFAVQAIDGLPQPPRTRPEHIAVSTHYTRTRPGGGQTQIAIIAAVERPKAAGARPSVTTVELSAWLLDLPRQLLPQLRRSSGVPTTAITTDEPALKRPRAATVRDTTDWAMLEYVAEAFVRHGARRLP